MGLRDFFVERVPSEVDVNDYEEAYTEETENVSVEGVSQESLIRDIYVQNELSDQSQSIFKIEEVINTLPKEMPTGTKRNAVAGMLSVFGLTIEQVVADGEHRKAVVSSAVDAIKKQNEEVISDNDAAIENRKLEIQGFEEDTASRKEVISNSEAVAKAEIDRIDGLIKFIGEE